MENKLDYYESFRKNINFYPTAIQIIMEYLQISSTKATIKTWYPDNFSMAIKFTSIKLYLGYKIITSNYCNIS